MSPEKKQQAPFFLIFPWFKVAAGAFIIFLGMMVVFRLSEASATHINHACLAAMIVAATSGFLGFYVIGKTWGRDAYGVLLGVMMALIIRLLISGTSFAIIIPFTKIHRSWYVLFLIVYYLAFLGMDTWFALWILKHSQIKDKGNDQRHGNLWDVIG
jgi:hypothetical protein